MQIGMPEAAEFKFHLKMANGEILKYSIVI